MGKRIPVISAAFCLFLFAIAPLAMADQPVISGSGCSVSITGYLREIAKHYEKVSGVQVLIRSGGSVQGLEDLRTGAVDFAASCRLRTDGDPADLEFVQVAWDALVFVVNPANPVNDISVGKARDINLGTIKNWKELGGPDMPIKLYMSRPKKGLSGVESSVRSMVMQGKPPVETQDSLSLASTALVEQMVEKDPAGFAITGYSSAIRRNVKILKLDGLLPSMASISNKTYPLRRPLYIVVPMNRNLEVKKFIAFVLGPEGQKFIRSQGVVALGDVK